LVVDVVKVVVVAEVVIVVEVTISTITTFSTSSTFPNHLNQPKASYPDAPQTTIGRKINFHLVFYFV